VGQDGEGYIGDLGEASREISENQKFLGWLREQATHDTLRFVMAGLVPAIHDLLSLFVKKGVDARDEPGHDVSKKDVDARAFAAPKGLRPRRRDKPGHDAIFQRVPDAVRHSHL
jgi:hypothetical protein